MKGGKKPLKAVFRNLKVANVKTTATKNKINSKARKKRWILAILRILENDKVIRTDIEVTT
jgi:hypothetical protein